MTPLAVKRELDRMREVLDNCLLPPGTVVTSSPLSLTDQESLVDIAIAAHEYYVEITRPRKRGKDGVVHIDFEPQMELRKELERALDRLDRPAPATAGAPEKDSS